MRLLTFTELLHLPRIELLRLERAILIALGRLSEIAPERAVAMTNLRLIRTTLARRQPTPG